ncbi:high mobility group B protein [Trifolium repens]|nr:high mobility group B protein [Trifolium repens]
MALSIPTLLENSLLATDLETDILNEKKPYLDRVIELKAKYEKAMEIYNATEKELSVVIVPGMHIMEHVD